MSERTLHPLQIVSRSFTAPEIHLDERTAVTSQLFFPESVNDAVLATSPYDASGTRDTRNSTDSIFTSATVVDVAADGGGYAVSLVIGVSA